jgi:hypothetical protein
MEGGGWEMLNVAALVLASAFAKLWRDREVWAEVLAYGHQAGRAGRFPPMGFDLKWTF